MKVEEYQNQLPALVVENYFNGTIDAYGVFQNRRGLVVKRFHCVLQAQWKDGIGTLDESFDYSDGSKSRRIWTLKRTSENHYEGTAPDVVGTAQGQVSGNSFHWNYTLDLPVDDTHYHVQFDDWMYLMDGRVLLNRAKMSKFGIALGEVTLSFFKR